MIILLFPSLLLIIPVILLFFPKLSNNLIYGILMLCFWGPIIALGIIIATQEHGGSADNIAGAILMCTLAIVANAIQYNIVIKIIEIKRCPRCHKLGVKTLTKEIREHIKTVDHIYRYESKNGLFRNRLQKIFRYTTYDLYCPECSHTYTYTDKKTERYESGETKLK